MDNTPYYEKKSWSEKDIIKAIEAHGLERNNYQVLIYVFTKTPMYTLSLSWQKDIIIKLCTLLETDKEEQEQYLKEITAIGQDKTKRPLYDDSGLSYMQSASRSNDIVLNLLNQLHLKRWDPSKTPLPITFGKCKVFYE